MATLLYRGGSLTFWSGADRRTVPGGKPFEVSDALAEILLTDPNVSVADEAAGARASEADLPRETPLDGKTKAQLLELASELGLELPSKPTNAAIVDAIEAERQRLADEAADAQASSDGEGHQGGDATPADDSGATAPDEAGTPPSAPGAVTLGDLPPGGRIEQG